MTSPMISAVRDMLLELARVEQAVTAHCAPGAVREHEYMACAKDGHEPCVVCQGGHDLCRRKDRAIADLANYGLALLAADSGTDIEPSLSAQVDRACGVRP